MWKIVTDDNFMNQNMVFPAAQPFVACIVDNARKYPAIKKVVVFGSSVTSAFSPVSDIDIFVDQDDTRRYLLAKNVIRGVDYWRKQDCDEGLLREIEKNGITVYVKE